MNHLSPETLLDLAEGSRAEQAEPHLAECDRCRHELTELRAGLSQAAWADVPEPSPLFWEHLSARISAAVEQETQVQPKWWAAIVSPWRIAALATVGVVLVAATLTFLTDRARHVATTDTTD